MNNDNDWMQCKFVFKSHLLTCILTHLYANVIKEHHAWYATNWKNLHEM